MRLPYPERPQLTPQRPLLLPVAAADAAGAPAIAVSGDGGYDQLLLDPVSYQVIGLRQVSTGIAPKVAQLDPMQLAELPRAERQQVLRKMHAALTWPRRGTVVLSVAYARIREVSGPGVR